MQSGSQASALDAQSQAFEHLLALRMLGQRIGPHSVPQNHFLPPGQSAFPYGTIPGIPLQGTALPIPDMSQPGAAARPAVAHQEASQQSSTVVNPQQVLHHGYHPFMTMPGGINGALLHQNAAYQLHGAALPSMYPFLHPTSIPSSLNTQTPSLLAHANSVGHDGGGLPSAVGSMGLLDDNTAVIMLAAMLRRRERQTYNQVIEQLGENRTGGKTADDWANFYLEHKLGVDAEMKKLSDGPGTVAGTPVHSRKQANKRSASRGSPQDSGLAPLPRNKTAARVTIPPWALKEPRDDGATKDADNRDGSLVAGGRPPLPPRRTSTKVNVRGHFSSTSFTDEDDTYLANYVEWALKQDPTVTQTALWEQVAQTAPHHSRHAWKKRWQQLSKRGVPDGADPPKPVESTGARTHEIDSDDENQNSSESQSDEDELYHPGRASASNRRNLGGIPYTTEDFEETAKWIASFDDWEDVPKASRWRTFASEHPHRSDNAWSEMYRRNREDIDPLVEGFKNRG